MKIKPVYFLFSMLISLFLMLGTMGCNTMQGAGKDIKKIGETIEKQAS